MMVARARVVNSGGGERWSNSGYFEIKMTELPDIFHMGCNREK